MISLCRDNIRKSPAELAPYCRGFLAVVLAFIANGLAEWSFGDSEVVSVLWLVTGLAVAANRLLAGPVKKII
ncbi:MAG: hypothetical protein Q8O74_09850, partial [bacterium]|nr:hypothetical protein [bacterium]